MFDDELRVLVSVDPSDGFESRVRARLAAEPARSTGREVELRLLAIAAAIVAAIMLPSWLGTVPPAAPDPSLPVPSRATWALAPVAATLQESPLRGAVAVAAPAPVAHRAGAHTGAAQIDSREAAALRQLFSSTVRVAIVSGLEQQDTVVNIPQIVIEPIDVDASPEGISR